MGDMSSGHDGELNDCKSHDDDVDGVLNLVGGIFDVHVVIVCNSPLCSLSDRGVRCDDVVGVAVAIQIQTDSQCLFFGNLLILAMYVKWNAYQDIGMQLD